MKSKLLILTTAAAMAAGTYYAVAQGASDKPQAPAGAGQTTGSTGGQAAQPAPAQKAPEAAKDKAAQSGASAPMKAQESKSESGQASKPATSGQAPASSSPSPSQAPKASGSPSTQSGSSSMSKDASPSKSQSSQSESGSKASPSGSAQTTSPSGAASSSASLSTEQRTQIRTTVLAQKSAPRVSNVNFSLSVGTVVPRTVHVVALPSTVVSIYPAWRGFMYFIVGDQIVVVEPGTLRIVAVLAA